jgi:hypothetical protein
LVLQGSIPLAITFGGICLRNNIHRKDSQYSSKAILQLEYDPKLNKTIEYTHAMLGVEKEELSTQQWKSFAHHWRSYNETSKPTQAYSKHMNEVFANCSDCHKPWYYGGKQSLLNVVIR